MALFLKNVAFHGILLDALFEEGNQEWEEVSQCLQQGIVGGVVQPLRTTVFDKDQVEQAFRYMAQGKHIGKVLVQVSEVFVLDLPIPTCMWLVCYCDCCLSSDQLFFSHRSVVRNREQLYRLLPLCLCQLSVAPSATRPTPTL